MIQNASLLLPSEELCSAIGANDLNASHPFEQRNFNYVFGLLCTCASVKRGRAFSTFQHAVKRARKETGRHD